MRLQRKQPKTQTHTQKDIRNGGEKDDGAFSNPKESWHISLTPAAVHGQDKVFPDSKWAKLVFKRDGEIMSGPRGEGDLRADLSACVRG